MPISKGFKDIKRWASAPTADRTAPDDASLTPPLVVADGYPASFSADDGNTPRRPVFNEQYHRETSALADIRNYGILPWDAEVDTLQGGLKQVAGVAYRALVDNGPSFSNAVSPTAAGQAVWEILRGVISDPSAPDAPMATAPRSGELDWFWNCPLDGGAQVTEFDFQWRRSGTGSWSPSVPVSTARAVLTSLTNGQPIEARVRARSSHGVGPWSAIGTATPTGTIPGGGSALALRADGGDAQVTLTWLEPDDGGVTITAYTVQWREDGQAFSSGRQTSVADAAATVGSLANGTTYYFRVRAINGEGNGAWSNEASATPAEDVPDRAIPDQADAPTGQAGNGEARWIATPPSDNGAEITAYIWRFRQTGAPNWSSAITRSIPALTRTGLTNGQTYEAQVRARNSVGTQASWSPSGADDAAGRCAGSGGLCLSRQRGVGHPGRVGRAGGERQRDHGLRRSRSTTTAASRRRRCSRPAPPHSCSPGCRSAPPTTSGPGPPTPGAMALGRRRGASPGTMGWMFQAPHRLRLRARQSERGSSGSGRRRRTTAPGSPATNSSGGSRVIPGRETSSRGSSGAAMY